MSRHRFARTAASAFRDSTYAAAIERPRRSRAPDFIWWGITAVLWALWAWFIWG